MRIVSFALVPDPDASDMGDLEHLETQLTAEFSPPLQPDEIRRHLLENDLVEAIIGLPVDMFYNTVSRPMSG